ncbi:MAG: hypothetical protein DMF84_07360 [Acidobacteria bacterium]|nr:MAG: hypothetical protein DMF84_07360 [Acidobacteriota bacterium]
MRSAWLVALALTTPSSAMLSLHIRVFSGSEEVSTDTRVTVFKAGERQSPVAESRPGTTLDASVAPGSYDAQAIRERDGRVVAIKWVERLLVMGYPDEAGRHLEVINLQNGFGALEVRAQEPGTPDVAIFATGSRQQEAARFATGPDYALFVVPAGRYDLRVRRDGQTTWHPDIEVPLDRTRFWLMP